MATILHVADPRIDPEATAEGASDGQSSDEQSSDEQSSVESTGRQSSLGGFEALAERATALDADAVLFTGNLFSRGSPDEATVERIAGILDELEAAGTRFLTVLGRNDQRYLDALGPVFDHPVVERLGTDPTDVGEETAVYGLDYRDGDELQAFLDDDDQFTPAAGTSNAVLAIPRRLAPPYPQDEAVTRPYEVATNVNLYLDAIAGGGGQDPATWADDDNDFGVYYPGSMNERWADATVGPQAIRYDESGSGLDCQQISLEPASLDAELAVLETLFADYDRSSLDGAEVEQLTDLYGLLSEAKSMLDDRRKEVRDVLLEQTAPGAEYRGDRASVYHYTSTRRRLRDDETVFDALDRAGVARESVTTEMLDSDKVEGAVEHHAIPEESVFEEQTRTSIRKRDVDLDR